MGRTSLHGPCVFWSEGDQLSTDLGAIDRLSAACDAGGWKEVLRVLAEDWDTLYRDHPADLLQTLDAMSEHVLDRDPRLRMGRHILQRNQDTRIDTTIPLMPDAGQPVERLSALTDRVVTARSMGRLAVALAVADTAVTYVRSLRVDALPDLARALPAFQYQWGTTFVQAGRFDDALNQFVEGFEMSQSTGNRMMMAATGGGAALVHTLHGRGRDADALLRQLPPARGDDWWAAPAPGLIADAWLHVDRFEYTLAANIIAHVDIARSPAFWVPYFVTRTYLAAAKREGRQTLLAEFDTFVGSLPAGGVGSPVHAEAISIVRYILLLHLHRPDQALRELNPEPVTGQADIFQQMGATIYARHLVTISRAAQARKLMRPLLNVSSSEPRILIRALLIAAETEPPSDRADRYLRRAVELAQWHAHYSALLRSSAPIRERAADILTESGSRDIADRIRALPEWLPDSRVGALTRKEKEVVDLAIDGLTNAEMAAQLHVSLNTVKSHLRHAYAKLGVSSRRQLSDLLDNDR